MMTNKDIDRLDKLEAYIRDLKAELESARRLLDHVADAPLKLEIALQYRDAAIKRAEELEVALRNRDAQIAAMRKALEFTLPFREFSDEWHDMTNTAILRFRELRKAALENHG